MRDHKREAARKVSLLLIIMEWCLALVLCSCAGMEESGADLEKRAKEPEQKRQVSKLKLEGEEMLLLGKWTRPGETMEFKRDGRMFVTGRNKQGILGTMFYSYWIEKKGVLTVKPISPAPKKDEKKWDFRISDGNLYLKPPGEWEERGYHKIHS